MTNKFQILDNNDPDWVAVRLTTENWIVDFHLSYVDEYGDFELYGDEPEVEYLLDDSPVFMLSDKELGQLVAEAKWV